MTLKAAVSPAESLTNFRSRVNLPEASTSPVEVLLKGGEGVGREAEVDVEGASVEQGRLHVEVGLGGVGQVQVQHVHFFTSQYGDGNSSQAQ